MGADYIGQEKAVKQIKSLPEEVRELLSHHLRNSLTGIIGGIQTGRLDLTEDSAKHLKEDLEKWGL